MLLLLPLLLLLLRGRRERGGAVKAADRSHPPRDGRDAPRGDGRDATRDGLHVRPDGRDAPHHLLRRALGLRDALRRRELGAVVPVDRGLRRRHAGNREGWGRRVVARSNTFKHAER